MAESNKKFVLIGLITIVAYTIPWLIMGILHWSTAGLDLADLTNVQFIVSLTVSALALATSFHLWSRVPKLEGQIRKLFLLTGFTFIVILGIFDYLLIDTILEWMGMPTIVNSLNNSIAQVEFNFFGIEGLKATMPADSFVTFALIIFAISFYIFPMEKYVKQTIPWHTYSLFACAAVIPVLILFVPRDFPGSEIVMSILTAVIVLWLLYNFLFLFYLYFSNGLKSPKGTAMRNASFMIGIGLLLILLTWISGWAINTGTPILDLAIQMSFGGIGIFIFNYGFYLIRPGS